MRPANRVTEEVYLRNPIELDSSTFFFEMFSWDNYGSLLSAESTKLR